MKIKLSAIIDGVRRDKFGAWKLLLEVPQSEAVKAATLGTQIETVFSVTFEPQETEQEMEKEG